MRKVKGYAYRYGKEHFVSLDPVVGGWPCTIQVAPGITVRVVTRREAVVDGERVSMKALLAAGKVSVVQEKKKPARRAAAKKVGQ